MLLHVLLLVRVRVLVHVCVRVVIHRWLLHDHLWFWPLLHEHLLCWMQLASKDLLLHPGKLQERTVFSDCSHRRWKHLCRYVLPLLDVLRTLTLRLRVLRGGGQGSSSSSLLDDLDFVIVFLQLKLHLFGRLHHKTDFIDLFAFDQFWPLDQIVRPLVDQGYYLRLDRYYLLFRLLLADYVWLW